MPEKTQQPSPHSPNTPGSRSLWSRTVTLKRLVILALILILANLLWPGRGTNDDGIQVSAAKGGYALDIAAIEHLALDEEFARDLALSDAQVQEMLAGDAYDFLYAVRLGAGETQAWRDEGCAAYNCAQVTVYNYNAGGTVEAIVNLDTQQVLGRWAAPSSQPGPGRRVVPRALDVAAANPAVQAVLGDIRDAETMMIPMPAWLRDDACSTDWCVDLTYHDPAGSGKIFHVIVNMDQGDVARTFFTRTREDRPYKRPAAQDDFFDNGCHEQFGWEVCWEMTGDDGINFTGATYAGDTVFSSAKIGQTEVWYPSWPGGYRDEVGFNATVRPYFGTEVNEFDNSFEVRQLFTEFLRWPNCICCYRYEQVVRFYDDGTFEFRFVSHGPGCEDLSNYRPLWRIDVDLGDPAGDRLWYWDTDRWTEAEEEIELGLYDDLGVDGARLATIDGDLSYRWKPIPTDPLGLDEGRLFAVRYNEGEGDGPITPGPADTFRPPRQWIDGERLSGENVVLWYVPFLKTKKGGPWWCMPDPEPDFSPCESILRVEPAGELRQPTPEELAQLDATATPAPTLSVDTAPTPTPRPVEGDDAEVIIQSAGCGACHAIGDLGEEGKVGPDLSNIGAVAAARVPDLTAEEYLRQSIMTPNAFVAPECPNGPCLANIMPQDYAQRLASAQIDTVVAYLLQLGVPDTTPEPGAITATPGPQGETTALPPAIGEGQATVTATAAATPPAGDAPTQQLPRNALPVIVFMLAAILIMLALARLPRNR